MNLSLRLVDHVDDPRSNTCVSYNGADNRLLFKSIERALGNGGGIIYVVDPDTSLVRAREMASELSDRFPDYYIMGAGTETTDGDETGTTGGVHVGFISEDSFLDTAWTEKFLSVTMARATPDEKQRFEKFKEIWFVEKEIAEKDGGAQGKKVGGKGHFRSENEFREWLNSDDESRDEYDEVEVEGDVTLHDGDKLKNLPKNLEVGGRLDLEGCTSLTSLPEGLKVGGWLELGGCTSLTSLPEGLEVGVDLYFSDCESLTSLPVGLKVGGDLYVDDSGVADVESHPGVRGKIVR